MYNYASGQSVMVAGTIGLSEVAASGTFVPKKKFWECIQNCYIIKIFVRTNIFVGYAQVGLASELLVKGVTFPLGNDLACYQVVVTPLLSPTLCEVVETKVLEEENLEVFPVCIVICSQSKPSKYSAAHVKVNVVADDYLVCQGGRTLPIWLGRHSFCQIVLLDQLPLLSRHTLIVEQKLDILWIRFEVGWQLFCVRRLKTCLRDFTLKDDVLVRKWRPATEEWSAYEQIVLPQSYHEEVLRSAHEMLLACHLGISRPRLRSWDAYTNLNPIEMR